MAPELEDLDAYPVGLEEISLLLETLRSAGFRVGVERHLQARHLLLTLASRGQLPDDPADLQTLLGPLLASTPQEQAEFGSYFERWLQTCQTRPPEPASAVTQAERPISTRVQNLTLVSRSVQIALLAVALLMIVFSFRSDPTAEPTSTPSPTPSASASASPNIGTAIGSAPTPGGSNPRFSTVNSAVGTSVPATTTPTEFMEQPLEKGGYWEPVTASFILVTLLLVYMLEAQRERANAADFLERRTSRGDPSQEQLSLPEQFADGLFDPILLNKAASSLRLHERERSDQLDVDLTIQRSLRQGGLISPSFKSLPRLPEYLVLVDRRSSEDHQARTVDTLVESLRERGVYVDLYSFSEDPTYCQHSSGKGGWRRLTELASLYPRHRLWVFAEPRVFFDPFQDELKTTFEVFDQWSHRFLFSPVPTVDYSWREEAITETGFRILPVTEEFLASGGSLAQVKQNLSTDSVAPQVPEWLLGTRQDWSSEEPPEMEELVQGLLSLRRGLGDEVFELLAACAIYPEIRWELTLLLSAQAKTGVDRSQLEALARLPWMRTGSMPGWLRGALLESLGEESREQIASTLRRQLMFAEPESELQGFELSVAVDESVLWEEYRAQAEDLPGSPLRDQVFLAATSSELSFELPRSLGQRLRGLFVHRSLGTAAEKGFVVSLLSGLALGAWSGACCWISPWLGTALAFTSALLLLFARLGTDARTCSGWTRLRRILTLVTELGALSLALPYTFMVFSGTAERDSWFRVLDDLWLYTIGSLLAVTVILCHSRAAYSSLGRARLWSASNRIRNSSPRIPRSGPLRWLLLATPGLGLSVLFIGGVALFDFISEAEIEDLLWVPVLGGVLFLGAVFRSQLGWATGRLSDQLERIRQSLERPSTMVADTLPGGQARKRWPTLSLLLIAAVTAAPLGLPWLVIFFENELDQWSKFALVWVIVCTMTYGAYSLLRAERIGLKNRPPVVLATLGATLAIGVAYLGNWLEASQVAEFVLIRGLLGPAEALQRPTFLILGGTLLISALLGSLRGSRRALTLAFLSLLAFPVLSTVISNPWKLEEQLVLEGMYPQTIRLNEKNLVRSARIRNPLDDSTLLTIGARSRMITFAPDGQFLVTEFLGNILFWDLAAQRLRPVVLEKVVNLRSIQFSPDGKTLAVISGQDSLQLWNLAAAGNPKQVSELSARTADFSPDGSTLAVGYEREISLRPLDDPRDDSSRLEVEGNVVSVAFAPDGGSLAVGTEEGLALWSLGQNREPFTLSSWKDPAELTQLTYSPNGKFLAASYRGYGEGALLVWSLESDGLPAGGETEPFKLGSGDYTVEGLDFTADSKGLLSTGRGLKFWRLDSSTSTWRESFEFPLPRPSISLALSPDDSLVVFSTRYTLLFWRPSSGLLSR